MISAGGPGPQPEIEKLFRSFRLVSADEASRLRPRIIQVAKAGPGETAQSIAARMATDNRLRHFLMLNGRAPDQPVRAGELVKIVVYGGG
jgi:predicted Zn-dependent protease